MLKKAILLTSLCTLPLSVLAAEITGKVQSISVPAKVIQYLNPKTKEVSVLKFTEQTKLVEASSFKDFTVNTKFKAIVDDNMVASQLKRILVKLPPELIISTDELSDLLDEGAPLFIGDARPASKYNLGHIPTSKPTPATELGKNLDWLPTEKATPLVFYCGGVTCPLSPKAMKIAKANGYKNVRAYVAGFPAWKGDVYPAHVNASWLKKNLDKHHVILDVREEANSSIAGAIHLSASELVEQHEAWNKEKFATKKRTFLGLRDKKAPITIVANSADADEAIEAFEILTYWKFKNVAILAEGLKGWNKQKLPTTSKLASKLNYEKKLAKGAIEEMAFVKAVKKGNATIIDVRSDDEMEAGSLKGAINIPLEQLDQELSQIPKEGLVILHCVGGSRAALAYTLLAKKGYTNVKYLNDSFAEIAKENGIKLI